MAGIEVSNPQQVILSSTKSLNLFLAGAGAGKTHTSGILSAEYLINYPKAIGLVGANTYQQLSKSTLKNIFESWHKMFGWRNEVEYVVDKIPPMGFRSHAQKLKSYDGVVTFNNGATIFTNSLDNYKAIDGTELGWAMLDETKDTKEEAISDVILWRLRQKAIYIKDGVLYDRPVEGSKGFNPLYIFTSPAKVDWLNEWFGLSDKYDEITRRIFSKTDFFHYEDDLKCVTISSTYHNEDNLPAGYIDGMLDKFKGNQDKIDMLVYGSPIAKTGGEFFIQFKRLEHVKETPFLPESNIHISLDFNVVPYITMTCWQIVRDKDRYKVRAFDEFCLSSPENNTEDLCKKFMIQYLNDKSKSLFYYGDASGSNSSTVSKEHNFDILERVLKKYLNHNSNRVMNSNPSVSGTRDFINKIYAGGHDIDVQIDPKCRNLILDNEFLKEDPTGGKLIQHATDKITGQRYEKYGHTSDSMRYFIISAFNDLYKKD